MSSIFLFSGSTKCPHQRPRLGEHFEEMYIYLCCWMSALLSLCLVGGWSNVEGQPNRSNSGASDEVIHSHLWSAEHSFKENSKVHKRYFCGRYLDVTVSFPYKTLCAVYLHQSNSFYNGDISYCFREGSGCSFPTNHSCAPVCPHPRCSHHCNSSLIHMEAWVYNEVSYSFSIGQRRWFYPLKLEAVMICYY